jgi:16S rRNA (guanine527-N7)-methyltransferase
MSADSSPREILANGARVLGVPLTPAQLDTFEAYAARLAAGRAAFNLTALTDPIDVALKHFVDSLTVVPALPPVAPDGALRLIDVGSGAGFPGLPVKIARPDVRLTLVEATAKKADWLRLTAEALGMRGVQVCAVRAEDLGRDPAHRAQYGVVTARAVAHLAVLFELCLPFLRRGGILIAQKTVRGAADELPAAQKALTILQGRLREVRAVSHPDLPNRALVVVEQMGAVPREYPRRAGMPAKKPLV